LALGSAFAAGELARRQAESDLREQADAAAALHAAVLRSELDKHRSLPLVLAEDPEAIALLSASSGDPSTVNLKLERLAGQTRAAAIYLIDARGVAVAASNWRLPTSFVGSDYGFRPYFRRSMAQGGAEFFALGTVSGRPGLYLARRLSARDGRPLGVVVVKVEFDALEAEWRRTAEPAYVADRNGVILITSVPEWRFRTIAPMTEAQRQDVLAGQTLGHDALAPLPFRAPATGTGFVTAQLSGAPESWAAASVATSTPGWTLHLLSPAGRSVNVAVANARAVAALAVSLLMGLAAVWLRRRLQAEAESRQREAARADLERLVGERTAELSTANAELSRQIEERRRAEAARELLRDELVQASKLAALGQIVASVAHEINQPVAAIQTQAETAGVLLDRDQPDKARSALQRIGDLTQRIGAITQELRVFSKKSDPRIGEVLLEDAIHGALLLTQGRLDEGKITLIRRGDARVSVRADRFRLEQVIVNLCKNAAEALAGTSAPKITLAIEAEGDRVRLIVADNGPGLSPDVREQLFTPFVTTRPNGLGLGLVICRDIIAGFGGELDLAASETGATFIVTLRPA
jgi:two-component system C4-dicarboxylate transport sensor histidine kinase DctB